MRPAKKMILITSIFSILFALYVYIIIQPQLCNKKVLQENIKACQLEIKEQKKVLSLKNTIREEYTKKTIEVAELNKKFFESIQQETIIVLLDKILNGLTLEVTSIDFSELRKEDGLDIITVTLPFEGTYEDFILLLKKIREYKRKIIINAINIDKMENQLLNGSIILDFYSLHNTHNEDDAFTDFYKKEEVRENPFESFENHEDNFIAEYIEEMPIDTETITKKLLYGFESSNNFFTGDPKEITGKLSKEQTRKEGTYSIKLVYDFLIPRKKNQGNIVLNEEKIFIKEPVKNIGLWVYAFERSNHKIGIIAIDRSGKNYNIPLTSQMDWTGWKHLKGTIPLDSIYPLKIQRIYIESLDYDKKIKGMLRFDQLEAIYSNTE